MSRIPCIVRGPVAWHGHRMQAVQHSRCLQCWQCRRNHTGESSAAEASAAPPRRYVPRRAILYIPGNDERKLLKIPKLQADCAVMDCEDGVALNRKEEARHTISKMLHEMDFGRTEAVVRVNSVQSGLAADDLNVTLSAQNLPQAVMIPKVEHTNHLDWLDEEMTRLLRGRHVDGKMPVVMFVESAVGMLNLRDVCERAAQLTASPSSALQLDGIVFGSDDFCADIGATRTTEAKELLYARQHVVLVAKAYRLQAIDMVHIDYKDMDGLRAQSIEGAGMGFTGKQVIHPQQVSVVQTAFTPSQDKIEWATELVKSFNEHQLSGKGAFTFRGSMIDMPLLLQAKNILQLVESIEVSAS